jgi:hypothetical protein
MKRVLTVLSLLVVILASPAQPQVQQARPGPRPKLPIDCGFGQPCTGTRCVHDTATRTCGSEEFTCDNDSQNYEGGNIICCTERTACGSCTIIVNGRERQFTVWSFTGSSGSCTPN